MNPHLLKKRTQITVLCIAAAALSILLLSLSAGSTEAGAADAIANPDAELAGPQTPCPPGTGNPSQVAPVNAEEVEVTAAIQRVQQATSFNDCCWSCEDQELEAIVPTAQGPKRTETDGRLPLRRKFCGTITKYGVNDETDDPRDFTINIRPAPNTVYANFVAGVLKTEETRLSSNDLKRFGPSASTFDLAACLRRANDDDVKFNKVIHAEVTPDEHFYGADGRFLPIEGNLGRCGNQFDFSPAAQNCRKCISGWNCLSELEPVTGRSGTEACVYGVYAYDHGDEHRSPRHRQFCRVFDPDHDHPEIHPFDAVWWRHPERKGWMFGVFQDDSNRYSFPHCGDDNNGNEWSQAPRDLTFRFPFKFPRRSATQRVCLRHVRTRRLRDNAANTVLPLNITTGVFVTPATESTTLTIGGQRLLEVVKELGSERETHVRVQGRIVGNDVVGQIVLRVAVGCDARSGARCGPLANTAQGGRAIFDRLRQVNRLVTYDKGDLGAGYFYAELTFECACSTR